MKGDVYRMFTMTWNESRDNEKMTATGAAAPPRSPVGLGRSCPISQSQGQCGEGYASRASTRARGRETG